MIYPTHDADGQPDYGRMNDWAIRCDHCGTAARISDAERWHQGHLTSDPSYCPACVTAIAKRLIDSATPRKHRIDPRIARIVFCTAVGTLTLLILARYGLGA